MTYDGKTLKDGEYLGFTFDAEDFKSCRKHVRDMAVNYKDSDGEVLPLEKRYSARNFSLDIVFENVIIGNTVELEDYYNIDCWENYTKYMKADFNLLKPGRMKYNEWNPVGFDGE